jgi:hypothetical protein
MNFVNYNISAMFSTVNISFLDIYIYIYITKEIFSGILFQKYFYLILLVEYSRMYVPIKGSREQMYECIK